jgi:UDP-glucose 4-epimerase
MKRILITGSNGFIGKALVSRFQQRYDLIKTGNSKSLNICDPSACERLPTADTIIHLAALSFIPESFEVPAAYYRNNIVSTINMLEKARKDGSKFIFFSTYVYGRPAYLPIDELHVVNPLNPYTESKVIGEQLCKAYQRDFNLDVTIIRPFNIYGPNQSNVFFIPKILEQIKSKTIHLQDPRPKRDFIYLEDVIDATEAIVNCDLTGVNVFNIASGVSTSVKEVVDHIKKISGSSAEIIFSNEERKGEVLDTVANIEKAKSILNWSPKTSLEQGLNLLVKQQSKI